MPDSVADACLTASKWIGRKSVYILDQYLYIYRKEINPQPTDRGEHCEGFCGQCTIDMLALNPEDSRTHSLT